MRTATSRGQASGESARLLIVHCNAGLGRFNPAFGAAQARSRCASYSRAGPRQPQACRAARVSRNPTPPACAPRGLSRREARHSRCLSAIGLMQIGNFAMTHLSNGTVVTDLDANDDNAALTAQGYTIRHVETWHRETDHTCVVWDAPQISAAELPY